MRVQTDLSQVFGVQAPVNTASNALFSAKQAGSDAKTPTPADITLEFSPIRAHLTLARIFCGFSNTE
ncbi:hypothetical protein DT23_14675 [Thioclava indica]|uniref:Uncharacterized protein n=1 Tax=Thioclava indica TaxID=1353528 RepID=A0A074JWS2_9RHOB|nr:hypothetical protein DT23_14675 [Thioclava indica]